jgi:AcrR family transcriptional regulator
MDTKERILKSAIIAFAQKGFKGTSIRDICKRAQVASSAIHYHFKNKDGLFQYLFESFGIKQQESILGVLDGPTSSEDMRAKLEMFLNSVISSFLNEPELFRLVQIEVEELNPKILEIFRNTFLIIVKKLVAFLDKAKEENLINKKIDSHIAVKFLLNHISGQIRGNRVGQFFYNKSLNDPKFRQEWVKQSIFIFLNGIEEKKTFLNPEEKYESSRTIN